ncbi:peptide ABC transporter permease [Devosia pacifica]|uniref:Peptide ABC transporter permease n=1 Tax=Devosia pacifica TaxID=1335967 RepID=A0A918S6G0_9HYPH|nr:ABC transporter permease [Devosia pacifica]GHA23851.1 peptide ABC transporter permease [Devosia pacifica]
MAELSGTIDDVLQPRFGNRALTLVVAAAAFLVILALPIAASVLGETGMRGDFANRLQAPTFAHWFGTDAMGQDMLARTIHGLTTSLWVGLAASLISAFVATVLAMLAAAGGRVGDTIVSVLIDATMGLPHIVLLILICFALGGGPHAVMLAVALTHWPRLARILRAEMLQVRNADYVIAARHFGRSAWQIAYGHVIPHLLPQILVGTVLMFPHAILHEASLTFLGFGLEPSRPAIGLLLADSMRYLTAGQWWLGLFPGLSLLALVLCFDALGNGLRTILDPRGAQL